MYIKRGNIPLTLVFFIFLLFFVVCSTQSPQYIYWADAGYSLSIAQQILLAHQQPYVDLYVEYGPLVFYTSAFAQWISDHRLIGEILLCASGFALAYTLFFYILKRIGMNNGRLIEIFLGLLLIHPPFWTYYFQLVIAFTLVAIIKFLDKNTLFSSFLLGSVLVIAALYRHDYGVICYFSVATAILSDSRDMLFIRWKKLLKISLIAFCLFLPWLIFLAVHNSLYDYLNYVTLGSYTISAATRLPNPVLNWDSSFYPCALCWYPSGR